MSSFRIFNYPLGVSEVESLYNGKPVDQVEKSTSGTAGDQIADGDFSGYSSQNTFTSWEKEDRAGAAITSLWDSSTDSLPPGQTCKVIGRLGSGQSGSDWESVIRTKHSADPLAYGIGEKFHISFWAKTGANQTSDDNHARPVTVSIVADSIQGAQSTDYISKDTVIIDQVWRKYDITLTSNKASSTTRTLEFQIGNSDTPVHLSGVSFSRVALLMELIPEGISSTGNSSSSWYDSSGNGKDWTIVGAQDTGKYQSPNYGYDSCNVGGGSSVFGYRSCATGSLGTAVGYCSCAITNSSASAFGYKSIASGQLSSAIGYNASAISTSSTAVGYWAQASATSASAFGRTAVASAVNSIALGYCSVARIECTANIGGAMITKKDTGENESTSFYQYSSAEITLMTKNIDLKATGTNDITVPSGSTFYISEMGVIITEWSSVTTQPTIKIGYNSTDPGEGDDKQLDDIQLSSLNMTGAGKRVRFLPAKPDDGETVLRITVINAASATTMKGRFYFKGMLIENQ